MESWLPAQNACVTRSDGGVVVVLSDRGEVRATLDGTVLAAAARDLNELPMPGDWVPLRTWPDGRLTVGRRLGLERAGAAVVPLRRPAPAV